MLRYNKWAMLTLIDACVTLTDEQLAASAPGRASVRELLMHVAGGQRTFVSRTRGNHEGDFGRGSAWPGFDRLRAVAVGSSDELIAIAELLDAEGQVDLPYRGKAYRYPTSFFLLHAIEHAIEHRTEIKVALDAIGVATPDLDGWSYAAAAGYGREGSPP